MRGHYDEITGAGAEVVAVGTGDERYAKAFVTDEHLPFPVLVDDDAAAANAAAVTKASPLSLLVGPGSLKGSWHAHRSGFRQRRSGPRVTQLGATFVLGPGSTVRYAHLDAHTADHAPIADVLAALST